jgi:hypothetical protein
MVDLIVIKLVSVLGIPKLCFNMELSLQLLFEPAELKQESVQNQLITNLNQVQHTMTIVADFSIWPPREDRKII